MPLRRIISGAQTGVDRAALDSAISRLIYSWGGWVPKGRLAEDGEIPERYFVSDRIDCGLKETDSSRYQQRTLRNIQEGDATLILRTGKLLTPGTKLTIKALRKAEKPYRIFNPYKIFKVPQVVKWICETKIEEENGKLRDIEILNIAGPRESKSPGIYEQTKTFLTDVFGYVFIYQTWGVRVWRSYK